MSIRVISGGQTGVDTGGLWAAREAGATWQAFLPRGWRREAPMPTWMRKHAKELNSNNYAHRTRWVVGRADAVLMVEPPGNTSPGSVLTVSVARERGVPVWQWWPGDSVRGPAEWIRQLLRQHDDELCLMVAGPRESKWSDGEQLAASVIGEVLHQLQANQASIGS